MTNCTHRSDRICAQCELEARTAGTWQCTCTLKMIQTPSGATQARLRDPKCPEHGRKQVAEPVKPSATVHPITDSHRANRASAAIDDFWLKQAGYS